eukprot:scaffold6737_cov155-Skeletonema_dohrnii-CCMP3373.AAC.2
MMTPALDGVMVTYATCYVVRDTVIESFCLSVTGKVRTEVQHTQTWDRSQLSPKDSIAKSFSLHSG